MYLLFFIIMLMLIHINIIYKYSCLIYLLSKNNSYLLFLLCEYIMNEIVRKRSLSRYNTPNK